MFEIIARLRTRPIEYRKRVAFWTAAGITGVIVLIWLIGLTVSLGGEPAEGPSAPGPVASLIEQLKSAF